MTELCRRSIYIENKDRKAITGSKVHYVYILIKIKSKLIVFLPALLPLIFSGNSSSQLLTAMLLELGALTSVLVYAAISRNLYRWDYSRRYLTLWKGVLVKKEITLPAQSIHSASVIKTPILSLFKAVRLEVRSSENRKKPEITLYLTAEEADALVNSIMRPGKVRNTFTPKTLPFLITAASRADFALGLTALILFVFSFGSAFADTLYRSFSQSAADILPYLPPVISVLSGLLLLGWCVNFLSICFTEGRLHATGTENCIFTVSGLISVKLTCIRKDSITACRTKETLLTSVFSQSTASILTPDGIHTALTSWQSSDSLSACSFLAGIAGSSDTEIHTDRRQHHIYWLPYAIISVLFFIITISQFITSSTQPTAVSYLCIFACILSLWRCTVGIIGVSKSKISLSGQHLTISAVRLFSFCTCRIPLGKIAEFEITQTVLQRGRKLCSVSVRAVGEKSRLKCRNLPIEAVVNLSERIK